jgi:hypothetical protein
MRMVAVVMPGLVPGLHENTLILDMRQAGARFEITWMAGTSPVITGCALPG